MTTPETTTTTISKTKDKKLLRFTRLDLEKESPMKGLHHYATDANYTIKVSVRSNAAIARRLDI